MAYGWRPKNAELDPDNPSAWGRCERCGMLWNLDKLTWQHAYRGMTVVNLGILVCPKHLDPLNPLDAAIILPPDPEPVFNERAPTYQLDEAGPTQELYADIATSQTTIGSSFYIDLYDGDPAAGGESVLATLTGSATRTNFAFAMAAPVDLVAANDEEIELTEIATDSARITHVAVFDAATGGSRIMSAPLSNPQTVTRSNGAAFPVGALRVVLQPIVGDGDFFGNDYFGADYFGGAYFA